MEEKGQIRINLRLIILIEAICILIFAIVGIGTYINKISADMERMIQKDRIQITPIYQQRDAENGDTHQKNS